jgi:hypothetical protein
MGLNLTDILDGLEKALPVLGGLTGHPEIGTLAGRLLDIAESEIERRRAETGKSRSEILADAKAAYAEAKTANEDLKKLGHESQ